MNIPSNEQLKNLVIMFRNHDREQLTHTQLSLIRELTNEYIWHGFFACAEGLEKIKGEK